MMWLTVYARFFIFALGLNYSLTSAISQTDKEQWHHFEAECGFKTNSRSGSISGPLGSGTYKDYSFECTWTITAPYSNRINLEADKFSLPGTTGNCDTDWVLIESVWANNQILSHGQFCGTSLPPKILSKENKLIIRYSYKGDSSRRSNSYFTFSHSAKHYDTIPYLTGKWVKNNMKKFLEHKEELSRIVSSIVLLDESYLVEGNVTFTNLTTEYRLHLASDLVKNASHPLSAAAISHHITALLALCSSPRSFSGVDLVERLRSQVNSKQGLVNPYYLLTLCNAGDRITASDVRKLKSVFDLSEKDVFWLDFQAMALIALVCAREQNRNPDTEKHIKTDIEKFIKKASDAFKNRQLSDGSFGSLQTTSLVVQALTAAEATDFGWDKISAIEFVESLNHSDGSFANFYNFYSAVPIISHKTITCLNASKCDFKPEGLTAVDEIESKLAKPISISYALLMSDQLDHSCVIILKGPNETSFFDFMRLAAAADEKFQFKWRYVKDVPYVYQIGELVNDPASGRYWTLHTGTDITNVTAYSEGLENYTPEDGDVAIMWYRTVTTEHPMEETDVQTGNLSSYF